MRGHNLHGANVAGGWRWRKTASAGAGAAGGGANVALIAAGGMAARGIASRRRQKENIQLWRLAARSGGCGEI